MREIIDARGLACPQPVILAKRALEKHERIVVMVDNAVAMENVRRLGVKYGTAAGENYFLQFGVQLTTRNSEVIDDLRQLRDSGVEILVYGTCVNFFGLSERIGIGTISNMYEVATSMSTAARLITP